MTSTAISAAQYDTMSLQALKNFEEPYLSKPGTKFVCLWCDKKRGRPEEIQRHMKHECRNNGSYSNICFADSTLNYRNLRVEENGSQLTAMDYLARLKQRWIRDNTGV